MVLVHARSRLYGTDPQVAHLLDAVENLPDLLPRWPDMNERIVREASDDLERRYPEWSSHFTRILANGAPNHWQLKWTS
jgi:hypothetical protein